MPGTISRRAVRCLALGLAILVLACQGALAQSPQPNAQPTVPQPELLAALIRSTLTALNHANVTGNYTVLRELGSPSFQATNSAAKLGTAFAAIRDQKLDLMFVAIATPQLAQPPNIDAKGVLRLIGFYPTRPLQVNFDLSFQSVNGIWRHSDIGLAARPADAAEAAPPAPAQKSPPPAKKAN